MTDPTISCESCRQVDEALDELGVATLAPEDAPVSAGRPLVPAERVHLLARRLRRTPAELNAEAIQVVRRTFGDNVDLSEGTTGYHFVRLVEIELGQLAALGEKLVELGQLAALGEKLVALAVRVHPWNERVETVSNALKRLTDDIHELREVLEKNTLDTTVDHAELDRLARGDDPTKRNR